QLGISRFVLISSAEVYGADYSNPGLMREKATVILKRPNRVAHRWAAIEALAKESFDQGTSELIVLRPCWTLLRNGSDVASRLFRSRVAFLPAGFDPSIQLLSVDDLAAAITVAIESDKQGVFNIAPDGVIPLRKALRLTSSWKLPIPCTFQRMVGAVLRWENNNEQFDFIRYSWTVSNEKSKDELGFRPSTSSAEALAEFAGRGARRQIKKPTPHDKRHVQQYDDFGMDAEYIRSCGRRQLDFMERVYWRIEVVGLEHLPLDGGGVLAGLHRGFMPFDGVMLVHLLSKKTGRIPRFLMHPALVKFPFLATFLTRLGGIIACQENADHVLKCGELVGVFPEGIRGAFRMYDRGNTYRLGKFRDDYVKTALRYGVPIVPFVTVGPAEIFPILAKIEWPWWKRQTHWPCFPITATWPLLP
ncbi:MAG: 1-acyl-sn-glycerol-3-phosphate acyltransferase, partial [Pseudomonadales bacterium]